MAIKIINYNPIFKEDFIRLNKAWLEEYFFVEEQDEIVFNNIEKVVLEQDGEIFFCLVEDEVAGTVAMKKAEDCTYELAKLAVDKKFQGRKLSELLMDAAIDFAIEKKATKIFLLSNTKLVPALNLYRKYQFVEVPIIGTNYLRADIQMELNLLT